MSMSPRLLRPRATGFDPRSISGLALWLDASDATALYTTDAGPVTAVSAPTEISGCVLWLDGADSSAASMTLDSTSVSTWKDKSGNGKDFTASGTARPTLTASGLNGKSVLTFDGINDQMTNATNVIGLPSVTLFAVYARSSGAYGGIITSGSSDLSPALIVENTNAAVRGFANVSLMAGGYTGPAVVTGRVESGASSLFVDGSTRDSDSSSGSISAGTSTAIGTYRLTAANFLGGYIAEIIAYNTALSAADRARVEAYLAAKWGISGVHAQATATSDPVGYWGDKSGNARHATQATGGSRPTVSATALNGKRQLSLLSQHLRGPSTTWAGSASIYWVGRTGQSTNAAIVFGDGTADQTDGFHAGWLNTAGVGAYGNGWQSGNAPRAESPSAWRNADIVAGVTLSPTEAISRVNGATTNTTAALTGSLSQSAAAQFYIGRETSGTWTNLSGSLAEVLIYQPALNASQRLRLERYLAAKWGITLAPIVTNVDAQDWIDRVYGNGGTVSASTAAAVNDFCNSIDAAGIRDRFFRLNLFAGTGLNACLVPLYTGPTSLGIKYGGAVDTNVGPFVSGDYNETGASGGLNSGASNSSKYLRTGIAPSDMSAVCTNVHASVYSRAVMTSNSQAIGAVAFSFFPAYGGTRVFFRTNGNNSGLEGTITTTSGHILAVRTGATAADVYRNGSSQGGTPADNGTTASETSKLLVFGTGASENASVFFSATLQMYSLGLGMTATQAAAFYSAVQAFQTALTRNV